MNPFCTNLSYSFDNFIWPIISDLTIFLLNFSKESVNTFSFISCYVLLSFNAGGHLKPLNASNVSRVSLICTLSIICVSFYNRSIVLQFCWEYGASLWYYICNIYWWFSYGFKDKTLKFICWDSIPQASKLST